jgi:hypothetical protein
MHRQRNFGKFSFGSISEIVVWARHILLLSVKQNLWFGSAPAIRHERKRQSGPAHKTALQQPLISVPLITAHGHKQPLEQTSNFRDCGGDVRIIASIEDPAVINQILAHLDQRVAACEVARLPQSRAPPQIGLFEETHYSNRRLQ